jgi:hypothetical protein
MIPGMQTKPPPEAHFSPLHGLWRSWMFDKEFIRDVVYRWKDTGLIYLHLVVAIIWLPLTAQVGWSFHGWVDQDAATWAQGMPTITVVDGEVFTNIPRSEMPWSWTPGGETEPVLLVDTTGSTRDLQGRSEPVLLTRHALVTEEGPVPLDAMSGFYMDAELVLMMADSAVLWFPVMYYLCAFLVSVTWRCLQCMVYGLVAWAMARFDSQVVSYGAGMRLAAMAITGVLYLDMVVSLLPFDIPGWGLVCFLVALGYLRWAVKVAAEGPPPDVAAWRRGGSTPAEAPAPS